MKLRSVAVNQFRKFTTPTRLDGIGDGLNILIGPNEMGKSTLLDAIGAVFFERYSSAAKPIRALQNDRNRAAPVVHVGFELEDGCFRIEKRFLKKPYARLHCPDGRRLEGGEAEHALRERLSFEQPGTHGANPETRGIWSVLWVRQGDSLGSLAITARARASLYQALEAEVGAVLGGNRGANVVSEFEEQLGALISPQRRRPRAGTEYAAAVERVATTEAMLAEAGAARRVLPSFRCGGSATSCLPTNWSGARPSWRRLNRRAAWRTRNRRSSWKRRADSAPKPRRSKSGLRLPGRKRNCVPGTSPTPRGTSKGAPRYGRRPERPRVLWKPLTPSSPPQHLSAMLWNPLCRGSGVRRLAREPRLAKPRSRSPAPVASSTQLCARMPGSRCERDTGAPPPLLNVGAALNLKPLRSR